MSEQLNQELGSADVLWNLSGLYASPDDRRIAEDIAFCRQEAAQLKQDCAGQLAGLEPARFAEAVRRLEGIQLRLVRLHTYAFLNFSTQTGSSEAGALLQKMREQGSQISKELVFFELEWAKMEQAAADRLLAGDELASWRHYLRQLRRYAAHLLSGPEEELLAELAPVGVDSWLTLFEKLFGQLKFGAAGRSEEEALSDLHHSSRETRRLAAQELTDGLAGQLHIITHIFNTVLADKMIADRLRRYPSWIRTRNLANELEDETVNALVSAVTGRYGLVQRYYRLKKDLLGLDELHDYDRYAPLPGLPDQLIPWQDCRETVLDGFRAFSNELSGIAELFFSQSWIHAPAMPGKRGGAFAHPASADAHPYVLVNYTGTLQDVSTVAHELGHGVHQYLAREQGQFNSSTPLVLAETASVFAELLIFQRQLAGLEQPEQRRAFICQKIESIFATVFRQIAMNRFEDMIHSRRREQGELSADELSDCWLRSQQAMFGDAVTLDANYRLWWSYIPHFLESPGYVYSYAFGELLVLSLYRLYQEEGAAFVPKYLRLLAAGGSQSPGELLAPFGVNLDDPGFWQGGLDLIEKMLEEVEALTGS